MFLGTTTSCVLLLFTLMGCSAGMKTYEEGDNLEVLDDTLIDEGGKGIDYGSEEIVDVRVSSYSLEFISKRGELLKVSHGEEQSRVVVWKTPYGYSGFTNFLKLPSLILGDGRVVFSQRSVIECTLFDVPEYRGAFFCSSEGEELHCCGDRGKSEGFEGTYYPPEMGEVFPAKFGPLVVTAERVYAYNAYHISEVGLDELPRWEESNQRFEVFAEGTRAPPPDTHQYNPSFILCEANLYGFVRPPICLSEGVRVFCGTHSSFLNPEKYPFFEIYEKDGASLDDVRLLGVGDDHACAVMGDNLFACWGRNDDGQLGDGTTTTRIEAQSFQVEGEEGKVEQLSLGGNASCAFFDTQRIYCWGEGYGVSPTLVYPTEVRQVSFVEAPY